MKTKSIHRRHSILIVLISFLAFIGFLDATYLVIKHVSHSLLPCTISRGCDVVLVSQYASILGVPTALFGSIYFVTVLVMAIYLFEKKTHIFHHGLFVLTVLGGIVSLGFFFIQAFILKSYCQYCIFSEIIAFSLLTLSFILLRLKYELLAEENHFSS